MLDNSGILVKNEVGKQKGHKYAVHGIMPKLLIEFAEWLVYQLWSTAAEASSLTCNRSTAAKFSWGAYHRRFSKQSTFP